MDWHSIGSFWLTTLAWVAGLAAAFGLLARLTPCNPGMYWWKDLRAVATDSLYWFVVPLFLRFGRTAMLIAGVVLVCGGREPQCLPVKGLPLWQQCLAVLLIQDVILYLVHRVFHTRLAWGFHAVHHSPKVLDWMSFQRFHPVNNLLEFVLADVAVLLLGFSPAALVALAPFNTVYSAMVHANLNWTFGPLRYVLASPVFHRWHHTTQEAGLNKNFASTFPILDLLCGTFHMPPGELPEQFGNGEPDFPQHFWGQFLHPFREMRITKWAWRRPLAASLAGACLLVVLCGLGSWAYYTLRLLERNEQLAAEAARATLREQEAGGPGAARAPAVTGVALSADGRLVWGSEDGTVHTRGAAGPEEHVLRGHERRVSGVAVSADGQEIVSGGYDGTVRVWGAEAGREQVALRGHAGAVLCVAVSADGRRVVSGGGDGTARVWDVAASREVFTLAGHGGAVPSVAVSADGRRVVTASQAAAKVWDTGAGREVVLAGHTDLIYGVAISPDGRRVVTGSYDQTVKVWAAETGRELVTLRGHAGPVYAVAVSPDGRHFISGGADGTVRVWDADGREALTFRGHTGAVTSVAVSADGERIISAGRDGSVRAWDTRQKSPGIAPSLQAKEDSAGAEPASE
jgi:sterol desaturase/sphingolipid hydroxylase (fatty acid hydroxylase superfamily)